MNKNMNNMNMNDNDSKDKTRMTAHEKAVNRGFVRKVIVALTIIMTVVSHNLPSVVRWVKQLKNCNDKEQLTLKGLFCAVLGEAAIYGMPAAVGKLLSGMGAPRPIVALTNNRKVIWLLNYIEDSYSSMDIKTTLSLTAQFALVGETIEDEVTKSSNLPLNKSREMTEEEVENM